MCKKAWCTCKVVVLLINLLLCLLFSLPSPSPSSLLKLPIVVIQKFCYHGNVTSHWPLSIGPVLLSKTIFRHWNSFLSSAAEGGKMSMDWCNLFKPYYYVYKKPPPPPKKKNYIWWNLRFDHIYFITLQELKQNWMQGWHYGNGWQN